MATEDMKGAYRQVPLAPCDVRYSITAVWNPATQKAHFFEMFGQPFGAGHAVPNFCRVAEWLCRFLQRFFYLHVDHFFDDFFAIEPSITLTSGMFVMREAFKTLGFTLDPDKSQPPAQICAILGVLFNTALLAAERKFSIAAKPSRLSNLESLIRSVLEKGELSPSLAASLVGKFCFLCSTLFGKVGRCCTAPLRHRQYSSFRHTALTPSIRSSLHLMLQFLVETFSTPDSVHRCLGCPWESSTAPPRSCPLRPSRQWSLLLHLASSLVPRFNLAPQEILYGAVGVISCSICAHYVGTPNHKPLHPPFH